MYFHKTPKLLSGLYPGLVWNKSRKKKNIYLTFDDGPCPDVTDFVLEQLHEFDAHATFFCVGDNIGKHPMIFERLVNHGHRVGNHTFNHLDGWKHTRADYLSNVRKCESFLTRLGGHIGENGKPMFRPPYGKIRRNQIKAIKPEYDIIMWDVLSGDFDQQLSPEKCLKNTIDITRNGSIVIFHDSVKAEKSLRYALPRFLEFFTEKGYRFKTL